MHVTFERKMSENFEGGQVQERERGTRNTMETKLVVPIHSTVQFRDQPADHLSACLPLSLPRVSNVELFQRLLQQVELNDKAQNCAGEQAQKSGER